MKIAAEEQRGARDVYRVAKAVHRNAGKNVGRHVISQLAGGNVV